LSERSDDRGEKAVGFAVLDNELVLLDAFLR
jgi:hypothetical protein